MLKISLHDTLFSLLVSCLFASIVSSGQVHAVAFEPMLILQKLPRGLYPQITQAPITTYADFLNAFRGGHTIDDNLGATAIANTLQASMLKIAIASGHLRSRNR